MSLFRQRLSTDLGECPDPAASMKIYAVRADRRTIPLIVHIADLKDAGKDHDKRFRRARRPLRRNTGGDLTMILPKADVVPKETTGGLDSVAVRFPSDRIAQELIKAAGWLCGGTECHYIRKTESDDGGACGGRPGRCD